jgi:copper transport protein
VASLGALAGLIMARRGLRRGWGVALLACLVLTVSPALMGHAVAAEKLLPVSLLSDWVHVTVAGCWLGGVTMLALLATPAAAGEGPDAFARLIELFHPLALAASLALVATGVVSLLLRVDHLADLPHSLYGAIFGAKLALTLGVAGVGFHHARRGPHIVRTRGYRALAKTLVLEAALAALVVGATAVLVGTSPPMPMPIADAQGSPP